MARVTTSDLRLHPIANLFGVASLKLLIVMEVNSKYLSRLLQKIVKLKQFCAIYSGINTF